MSTEDAPPPKKNQPPPALFNCGSNSCTFMPGGTPHEGWKMMSSMSEEKNGVGEPGLPTTIFSVRIGLPSL